MKKQILTLAFAAVSMLSMNVFARTPACNKTDCTKEKKECKAADVCKKDKTCKAACVFEGLNLTDAQKAQLKAIPAPGKVAKEMRRAASSVDKKADKKVDKKAFRMMIKDSRANYLKEVKKILSADQYIQFLENYYISNPAANKGSKAARGAKGHHGHKAQKKAAAAE